MPRWELVVPDQSYWWPISWTYAGSLLHNYIVLVKNAKPKKKKWKKSIIWTKKITSILKRDVSWKAAWILLVIKLFFKEIFENYHYIIQNLYNWTPFILSLIGLTGVLTSTIRSSTSEISKTLHNCRQVSKFISK